MLGIDHTTVSEIQILLRERFFLKMNQMNRYFFTDFFLKIAISR